MPEADRRCHALGVCPKTSGIIQKPGWGVGANWQPADEDRQRERKSSDMETPILSVDRVNKHFGGVLAINNLSFDVQAGEVIGLMGPNGAGKTTLLNVIAGEYKPDSGTVKFKGNNITGLPPHKICHLGVARTYQIPQPFVNLTALQNIAVAATYARGLGKADAEIEAAKLLDRVGLSERKDMFARDLLMVSLKRLELARVLATSPALLMIDEVAAGLTEAEIPQVLDLLKEIRKMEITVILIEHVMKVMVEAVDRIVVMDKGVKLTEGKPNEVMEDRRVIEAYLG
jgi:branched-chain amino acid transport system ATP-binding protein